MHNESIENMIVNVADIIKEKQPVHTPGKKLEIVHRNRLVKTPRKYEEN